MAVALDAIDNEQQLEVGVTGPGNARRLIVVHGTAVFVFTPGSGNDSARDTLAFPIGPALQTGQFIRATATASLASIFNGGLANNALWAVDSVDADFDDEAGRVVVTARLAVDDTDGFLLRIGFEVDILTT